ncbi:hypothetical protein [Bradyrhizobium sp. CCBAU 53421]|nr:hypothetical protein [Bradyrhizobium sp. CCBAU 53421]
MLASVIDYDLGKLDRRLLGATARVNATNLFDTRYQTCQAAIAMPANGVR